VAKSQGEMSGDGMMVRSGTPSRTTLKRSHVPDFEVEAYGVGPKEGEVSFFLKISAGFFSRCALAWKMLTRGEVYGRMHRWVSLDLSRRLMKAAAAAELGEDYETQKKDEGTEP
jgi:hypothetical protein